MNLLYRVQAACRVTAVTNCPFFGGTVGEVTVADRPAALGPDERHPGQAEFIVRIAGAPVGGLVR